MDDLLEEESLSEDDSVSEEYGSSEEDDSESSSRSKGAIQPISPNVGPAESPRQQTLTFVPRAAIQRERSVKVNRKPPRKSRHRKKRGENNPKNISVNERVSKFPSEFLEYRSGRLFCGACSEFVSTKLTTIKSHLLTKKHKAGKESRRKLRLKELTIAQALKQESHAHKVGEMLPEEHRAFRVHVVESFLAAGVPLSKLDSLRNILERGGYSLTTSSAMAELIPTVQQMEMSRVRADLGLPQPGILPSASHDYSVIFDGTTRLGEAIAIIIRYVNDEWQLIQRLVRLDVVAKSVNAAQLSQVLIECLLTHLQLRGQQIKAIMRDGAAVNGAAVKHLQVFMPLMMNVVCFSHTLDNVGQHFNTPVLDEFGQNWIRLFSVSHKAKLQWKEQTGQMVKSFSVTRWWSRWEVYHQLLLFFGDVLPFLENNQDVAPKLTGRLSANIHDPQQLCHLKLELAVVVDIGQHFVKATYDLEGDSALALCCYERLQAVCNACRMNVAEMHLPNLHSVARDVAKAQPDITMAWAEAYGQGCVCEAVRYFLLKFNVELVDTVRAFKAARLMCPATVRSLDPTPTSVQQLRAFPFLDEDGIMDALCQELPSYLACAEGVSFQGDSLADLAAKKVEWWRCNEEKLPHWSKAVKLVLLVQPSSAASERVFSLLKAAFSDQQQRALRDYLESTVMLQYNHRR